METIAANAVVGKPRRETLNGRDYLVAPLTLIVPGVLNGSQGALYYPEDETSKDPSIWNWVPIVVGHPMRDGAHVSARDPDIINEQGIGVVLRTNHDGKLSAEGWFDVAATRDYDQRAKTGILPRLQAGESIELSTGLFTENEMTPGVFNGIAYDAVARNYRPDHLAVLLNEHGACSVADGCGINVNEQPTLLQRIMTAITNAFCPTGEGGGIDTSCGGGGTEEKSAGGKAAGVKSLKSKPIAEHTYEAIDKAVNELTTASTSEVKDAIIGVFGADLGEAVIASGRTKKGMIEGLRRNLKENLANYKRNGPESVPYTNSKGATMNRKQTIDFLVANCDCWKDSDREVLGKFTDEKLTKLAANAQAASKFTLIVNRLKANADGEGEAAGVDIAALAEFLAITVDPASDPVGFVKELQDKLASVLAKLGGEGKAPEPEAEPEPEEPVTMAEGEEEKKELAANRIKKPATLQQWEASMPVEAKAIWNSAKEVERQERTRLVEALVSNSANDTAKRAATAIYGKMDLPALRALVSAMPPKQEVQEPTLNFFGASGGPAGSGKDDSDNLLPTFAVNFDEMASPKLRQKQTA